MKIEVYPVSMNVLTEKGNFICQIYTDKLW